MGITRFTGPVYGAKASLFSVGPVALSGASTTLQARTVVPVYETWYLTELAVSCSTNSSNAKVILKVKGTSTDATNPTNGPDPNFPAGNPGSPFTLTGPTSTSGFNQFVIPTAQTPGEYEGYAVPGNSTIRIVSSGTMGVACLSVRGFIRYLDSTRAV